MNILINTVIVLNEVCKMYGKYKTKNFKDKKEKE